MAQAGRLIAFAGLAGFLTLPQTAGATTIDFNELTAPAGATFASTSEYGFTVTATTPNWFVVQGPGTQTPYIEFSHPISPGSTTTGSIDVTQAGGDFTLTSLRIYSSITTIPYTLTGLLGGETVFQVSDTVPLSYGTFITVLNPDAADLIDTLQVSLSTYVSFAGQNPVAIDDIVVAGATTVPETSSFWLLCGGASLLGPVAWRRSRPTRSTRP